MSSLPAKSGTAGRHGRLRSGPSISRHLSILKGADLVAERREGNRIVYQLEPEQVAGVVGDFLSAVCPTQVLRNRKRKRSK